MTKLNVEVPKDSQLQALISIMLAVREIDFGTTSTAENKQPTKRTEKDFFYSKGKDQLDFQIDMIQSLAG